MRALLKTTFCLALLLPPPWAAATAAGSDCSRLAQQLLEHVKYQENTDAELVALQAASADDLYRCLDTDNTKKAFWLNVYNALAQIQLAENPRLYENKAAYFTSPCFTLAGHGLSLDAIEHRLLRRAEPSFLPRFARPLFMSPFMRRLSVAELDPRIHFALNCAARSCPPILFYDARQIDRQLDAAALNYLAASVTYDAAAHEVVLPELFSWFAGDFGGREGIVNLLRKHNIIGPEAEPRFSYKHWDWTPQARQFK